MIDKFSQALTLIREAFEDARTGAALTPGVDLTAAVDGAQRVINAAGAVQALRVAQYAGREQEQDPLGAWVEVDHGLGHVSEFAPDCFGPMLSMGFVAAGRKVATAAALAAKLPATLAAMAAGDLDSWRATIIATEDSGPTVMYRLEPSKAYTSIPTRPTLVYAEVSATASGPETR